jgi:ADP-ribosylglycohydrolase
MRTYPLGVMCFDKPLEETFRIAREFSLVTHADPRCIVSCCLVTALIRGILREEAVIESDIDKLIEESLTWTESWISEQNSLESSDRYTPIDRDEFRKHAFAQSLEDLQLDDAMKMGYVYKTLGSSILLLRLGMRRSKSCNPPALFEDLITDLIMQGGDADTNAAVAGSLLGTLIGYNKLPAKWRDGVMHGGWLLEKCDALASTTRIDPLSEQYNGKDDPDTGLEGGKPRLTLPELHQREREFSERWLRASSEALEKRAREKGKIDQARKDRPGSRLRRFLFGK